MSKYQWKGETGQMSENRFSISEAIKFGWETIKNNIGFFIALLVIAFFIENTPQILGSFMAEKFPLIGLIFSLAGLVLVIVVQMGFIRVSLKFCDGTRGKFDDLISTFNLFFKFAAASFLYGLIVVAGTLLLVVPGIIWGIKYSLFAYFIVDEGLGPIAAIKASGAATDNAKTDLFLFGLLLGLINFAGALGFFIGLFVTIPLSMVAYAYVYRELAGKTNVLAPSVKKAGPKGAMYIKLEA